MGRSSGLIAAVVILAVSLLVTTNIYASSNSALSEDEVYKIAQEIGEEYNICPELLVSIAFQESRYDPTAESKGCYGLMQISKKYQEERMQKLSVTDLFNAHDNMLIAADLLYELFQEYDDVGAVLMYYNGDSNVEAFIQGTAELSNYAQEILERSAEMERAHGK